MIIARAADLQQIAMAFNLYGRFLLQIAHDQLVADNNVERLAMA